MITPNPVLELLSAKKSGQGYIARCPAHGDRTPSLSLRIAADGKLLYKCHAGCDQATVTQALRDLGVTGGARFEPPRQDATTSDWIAQAIRNTWDESRRVVSGDPVDLYLRQARLLSLEVIPDDLRFHPRLGFYERRGEKSVKLLESPAMVAAVRKPDGSIAALHRTYLTADGRKLSSAREEFRRRDKKIMAVSPGSTQGAAIRLAALGDVLVVAEGIESALAASILSGYPSWAACTSGGLAALKVPGGVKRVVIAVDADEAGEKAAGVLSARLRERKVDVVLALASSVICKKGADWADVLEGKLNG